MKLNMWTVSDWFKRRGRGVRADIAGDGELIGALYPAAGGGPPAETALLIPAGEGCVIRGQRDSVTLPDCAPTDAAREFADMQRFYNEWEQSCLISLIDIRNPQSLVDLTYDVLSRPICFKNNEELVFGQTDGFEAMAEQLASSPQPPPDSGVLPYQQIKNARRPIVFYSRFYHCTVAQANLWKKNENVGSVIIMEAGRPFTKGDIYLIERFAAFMHMFLEHDRSDLFSGNGTASLLVDLVRGKDVSMENLHSLYSVTHWSVNDMFILLCFRDIFDGETPLKRTLRSALKREFSNCQLMFYEDVVGIINITKTDSYGNVIKALRSVLPPDSPPLGASFPFKGLERMNIYYRQAQLAIQYAQQNGLPFADTYDIALSYMTDAIFREPTSNHMLHPDVLRLLSTDQAEGTDYSNTLLCWLMSGGNYTDTAQKLSIHRNTAIYRMNRIAELMTTDLQDMENRKLLLFSSLVLEPNFCRKNR